MPQAGQKTITISGARLKKLEDRYVKEKIEHPTLSFSAFITESALMELERKNILREAQLISLIGENNGIITLKDFQRNTTFIEIQIKDTNLFCVTDKTDNCIHVGFALALPEIRKRIRNK